MSEAIDDLRKARAAAVHNRREHARQLKGLWAGPETEEALKTLVLMQQALDAIDSAIAHEEGQLRRGPVTVIDLDEAPGG